MPDVSAMNASENNCRATGLMFENVIVSVNFLATAVAVATLKLYLSKEISSNAVDLVELGVRATEGTVVGVLREPVALAVGAYGFLTDLAFQGVLQNIVADTADQLW
jgi:hypothetical protein